jgi:SHS2 domain-containing protein
MANKDYKILPHPADVRVQTFGKTKEELFLNAMLGMGTVLQPKIKDKKEKIKNKIKIKSIDLNALLVDFLSEILYLVQTNKEVYDDIKFKKFLNNNLEAELIGNKVESFGEDIKAVTYHGLKIEKSESGFQATILLDI